VVSVTFNVTLKDEFAPFLRPNQYVNYAANAVNTIAKAAELTKGLTDPLDKVKAVYQFVVTTLTYDRAKASSVQSGYLPVLDTVLAAEEGHLLRLRLADDRHAPLPGRALQAGGGLCGQRVSRLDKRLVGGDRLGQRGHILRRQHLAAHGSHLRLLRKAERRDHEVHRRRQPLHREISLLRLSGYVKTQILLPRLRARDFFAV
jgi:hypothetical protein